MHGLLQERTITTVVVTFGTGRSDVVVKGISCVIREGQEIHVNLSKTDSNYFRKINQRAISIPFLICYRKYAIRHRNVFAFIKVTDKASLINTFTYLESICDRVQSINGQKWLLGSRVWHL